MQTRRGLLCFAALLLFFPAGAWPSPGRGEAAIGKLESVNLLAAGESSTYSAVLVHRRGIEFTASNEDVAKLRAAGASEALISAMRTARQICFGHRAGGGANDVCARSGMCGAGAKRRGGEAEKECRNALNVSPRMPLLITAVAITLERQGRHDEALKLFASALDLDNDLAITHAGASLALAGKGNLEAAVSEGRQAIGLNLNLITGHLALASALNRQGKLDGAIAEFEEALRLEPDSADAHIALGGTLVEKGDLGEGVREFREAVRLDGSIAGARPL